MAMSVEAIAALVGGEVRGDRALQIEGARALDKALPHEITFVAGEKNVRRMRQSRAGAVFVAPELAGLIPAENMPAALVLVEDPQAAFLKLLETLRPRRPRPRIGISPGAQVSPTAQIGEGTNVYPGAYIGDDAVIGRDCDIHPGAVVSEGCVIGDHTTIYANAVLYPDVQVGDDVVIDSCAVLGADGFGYRLVEGRHQRLPHFGTVRIESAVEVGAGTTIDRAMIGETVIGEGTKLDNLVVIAHNCEIGAHNILISQVGLAGSVTTGRYVVCAGQVGVADHVHLGDGCVLGAKSGVHRDLPGGRTYLGSPAIPEAEAGRMLMAQRRLPELRHQIRALELKVAELTAKVDELTARRAA